DRQRPGHRLRGGGRRQPDASVARVQHRERHVGGGVRQVQRPAVTGPDGIPALALHHLGMRRGVHYAPDIPPAKEAAARAVHAAHLPESEPVLVLYDDTAFGSAKLGFLITAERICWKNRFFQPHQIPWSEVDPSLVSFDGSEVAVARGSMSVSDELAEAVAQLIVAVA